MRNSYIYGRYVPVLHVTKNFVASTKTAMSHACKTCFTRARKCFVLHAVEVRISAYMEFY